MYIICNKTLFTNGRENSKAQCGGRKEATE